MNRSPAYQYYPDKYECHTRHLSDYAYRIYHRLLNWMWLHSKDYCSISADANAVAVVLGEPSDKIVEAMKEITNPHMPLLKKANGKWVNSGLKKEAKKQRKWREKSRQGGLVSANTRKQRANDTKGGSTTVQPQGQPMGNSLSPSPSPSPTVVKKREDKKTYGEFSSVKLTDEEHDKLLTKHGKKKLSTGIEVLDGYIASKGAKYKSHYATMKENSWVWDRVSEQASKNGESKFHS